MIFFREKMDEGCLKDFNYESICRLIKAKKESEYQAHRKAVVNELKRIFETVKYNVESGDANTAFNFDDVVDLEIRKDVVKELCARFPERVAFLV